MTGSSIRADHMTGRRGHFKAARADRERYFRQMMNKLVTGDDFRAAGRGYVP
jgi:hypothetical protein